MYKVGLTGGIGSGKSKVAEFLRDRGVAIYDSDSRAKALMAGDETLREALIAEFGKECYTADGLNRAWLAERVFSNEEELAKLKEDPAFDLERKLSNPTWIAETTEEIKRSIKEFDCARHEYERKLAALLEEA
jgi:hypothetical protein